MRGMHSYASSQRQPQLDINQVAFSIACRIVGRTMRDCGTGLLRVPQTFTLKLRASRPPPGLAAPGWHARRGRGKTQEEVAGAVDAVLFRDLPASKPANFVTTARTLPRDVTIRYGFLSVQLYVVVLTQPNIRAIYLRTPLSRPSRPRTAVCGTETRQATSNVKIQRTKTSIEFITNLEVV